MTRNENSHTHMTRRDALKRTVGAAVAGAAMAGAATPAMAKVKKAVKNGRINQSVVHWCFNVAGEKWDLDKTCSVAKALGCKSVELIDPPDFATLKKHGLICAITPNGMPGMPFVKGFNNLKFHDELLTRTKQRIDANAEAGFPNVIAFNGYKWRDPEDPKSGEIPLDEGAKNCEIGWKKLCAYAEKKGVDVCVEVLNTRDDTHPMKGHPGYQGDHVDYIAEIIRKVGSPRLKILFDIYHVQVMDGDVIRRLRQHKDLLGHIHVAGNPGRGELDDTQEINYVACMQTLVDLGYKGYVGQEFIPTRDPVQGLYEAVSLCDV